MIVIAGAGYAGAATAWSLARRGMGSRVVLLEAETTQGRHASGRNAGLVGPLAEEDPALQQMALLGGRALEGMGMLRCGSVRLVRDEAAAEALGARARALGLPVEILPTPRLARQMPVLAGASSAWAVRCPADGTVEPQDLLGRYLAVARDAGARLLVGARLTGLSLRGGKVSAVETTAGRFPCEWLVNAAGAWAGELATRLSDGALTDLGLVPYRRHIFETEVSGVDPSWPYVWDLAHDVYFRAREGGLIACPCDEEPHPAVEPDVSAAAAEALSRKIMQAWPALASVRLIRPRACLRTFAADRRYVIGPDPRLPGFFWVAGLGGTGAMAGPAVGEMAADLMAAGEGQAGPWAASFRPSRLIDAGGEVRAGSTGRERG